MTLTDKVREEFGRDNIRVQNGIIQVYWHFCTSRGAWAPLDGGPIYGEAARTSVHRLVQRILDNRDQLPIEIAGNIVLAGEMNPDGQFITHVAYKPRETA